MNTTATVVSLASRKSPSAFHTDATPVREARVMGSNVARDILKRSSDFRDFASVLFEYIANAHESYQIDDLDREVHIDIVKGPKGKVQIRDNGCGMKLETLIKFWTMHGETARRENGLNMRGYNGTGKIACYKYFNSMTLETVQDGLRQITRLNRKHIEEMAKTADPVVIDEVAVNEPTDFPNGTTVTLAQSIEPITAAQIIELRKKIAMEMMMWMKGTKIYVNGELVEQEAVTFDETHSVTSECGCFTAELFYLDKGYKDEMQAVFVNAGPVFIAAENYGKEGHRFSAKVHGIVSTTKDWYSEHFEGRREQFVAEARDLKLKQSHPEARRLKEFAETVVRAFMKQLDDREKEREQQQLDEKMKASQALMSRVFSNLADRMNFLRRKEIVPNPEPTPNPTPREKSHSPRDRRPKLNVIYKEFENDTSDYRIDMTQGIIEVNLKSPQLTCISENRADATWDQAILEIVKTAFVELQASGRMTEAYGDRSADIASYLRDAAEVTREIRISANTMLSEIYRGYQTRRLNDTAK